MSRRLVTLAALTGLGLSATALASAADLGVSSGGIATATRPSPPFHATSVDAVNVGANRDVGQISQDDRLTLTFSAPVAASSVCAGFTGAAQSGYTLTLTDATPSDLLRVTAGPGGCTPRVATITLGSNAHVTANRTVTGASLQLTSATTLVLTIGNVGNKDTSKVSEATVLTATPDAALRDTSGRAVSLGTASTPAEGQF